MTVCDDRHEWLEVDGLGGFASGTSSGIRTRRYHALLLAARTPPTGRMVLVNGYDGWIEPSAGSFALTSQRYAPGVVHPNGASRIREFRPTPWPTWTFIRGGRAKRAIDAIEARLWTPIGLRSLAADEAGYCGHYGGGVSSRDSAYHQGTVWPWLLTPFVEGWLRARGRGAASLREARERFLMPLLRHLDDAGLGHVSEIADGNAPFTPNGCPFQAWSVGEALRLERVLAQVPARRNRSQATASNHVKGALHEMGVR